MSRLDKPRCVRTRHGGDVRPPSPGSRGKLLKRLFLMLLSLLQPVAGGDPGPASVGASSVAGWGKRGVSGGRRLFMGLPPKQLHVPEPVPNGSAWGLSGAGLSRGHAGQRRADHAGLPGGGAVWSDSLRAGAPQAAVRPGRPGLGTVRHFLARNVRAGTKKWEETKITAAVPGPC